MLAFVVGLICLCLGTLAGYVAAQWRELNRERGVS